MENITQQIAKNLKQQRALRGWSLDQTAKHTGVSKAMLGQIERGESSPTVATLWKIATGLQISFSSLTQASQQASPETVSKVTKVKKLSLGNKKMQAYPIFPFDEQTNCEIFIIELLPGCEYISVPHDLGVIEHILVSTGSMEVLIDEQWKKLTAGEGIRFAASKEHGYRNLSKQKACFHNVIHYP